MPGLSKLAVDVASMEPSSAEDGDVRTLEQRGPADVASMEPSSAEDGDVRTLEQRGPADVASMEPSSAEDGDNPRIPANLRHCVGFNGAVLS